jgi:hypothetical protein
MAARIAPCTFGAANRQTRKSSRLIQSDLCAPLDRLAALPQRFGQINVSQWSQLLTGRAPGSEKEGAQERDPRGDQISQTRAGAEFLGASLPAGGCGDLLGLVYRDAPNAGARTS